tara:strand:- start:87 stop:356 length:270 start_codon:yes stop_codon:yes gene_type:complete
MAADTPSSGSRTEDARYPYTHAWNLIRVRCVNLVPPSGSEVADIVCTLCDQLGMDLDEVATKLADRFLDEKDLVAKQSVAKAEARLRTK